VKISYTAKGAERYTHDNLVDYELKEIIESHAPHGECSSINPRELAKALWSHLEGRVPEDVKDCPLTEGFARRLADPTGDDGG
jgi:hypothetical protein